MTTAEIAQDLSDPFAALLLLNGVFPSTAQELLDALDAATGEGDRLREQRSFMLGEGSQLPVREVDTDSTNRGLRFLIARGGGNDGPDLIISASHPFEGLVELMAWDMVHQGFNFYRTLGDGGRWVWAGNSRHALQQPTRGKGPFESHPSGNLIMKELKFPWVHWHSFKVHISAAVFEEADVPREHQWFLDKSGAETCETDVVMPSIVRWTNVRFERVLSGAVTIDPVLLIEHVVTCPTVNLASSGTESAAAKLGSSIDLPPGFFVDADAMEAVGLPEPPAFAVPGEMYASSLETFGFHMTDGSFSQPGDTHFAFVVPERAFEDIEVLRQAIARGVISPRLAAALLMVDFPNPVFSRKRAKLLASVPSVPASDPDGLSEAIAASILAASEESPDGTPERDFAARWNLGDDGWRESFSLELNDYYTAVESRLGSQQGFNDFVRLAESRRHHVRDLPIFESRLLFPETNLDRQDLVMSPNGTVTEAAG